MEVFMLIFFGLFFYILLSRVKNEKLKMNDNLLELAKEAGSKEGESWCKGYHCFTINQLEKFAELAQANNVSDAEAKLKIAIDALNDIIESDDSAYYVCEKIAKKALEKIGE